MTPHHPVTFHGMSSKPSAAPGRPGRPRGRGSRGKNWSTAKKRKSPPFDGTVYLGTEIVLETSRGGGDGRSYAVTSYNPRRARWTATPRDGDGPEEEITHGRLLLGADLLSSRYLFLRLSWPLCSSRLLLSAMPRTPAKPYL